MEKHSIEAKKSLGQHFLTNPKVVLKIVEAAHLKKGDAVLEIGPGTGALTEALLEAGAQVVALEADARAVDVLNERFTKEIAAGALTLHHTDVRKGDITDFMAQYKDYSIVANIPYYLSGMLIRTSLSALHQPKCVVFLVQKEVAVRVARSEKESLLSLSVKVFGTPQYVDTVSRGNFNPPPAVDSAILAIDDISRDRFDGFTEEWFFSVLHAGFAARRKQLLGNLTALREKNQIIEVFERLGIPQNTRGEDLSVDTWCALARELS